MYHKYYGMKNYLPKALEHYSKITVNINCYISKLVKFYYNLIKCFSPFYHLNPPKYSFPISSKFMTFSLLLLANIFMYVHIHSCINLCSLCTTFVYVFMTDHLTLNGPLVCFSLGKTLCPLFSFPQLPLISCIRLSPHGFLPCSLWCVHFYHPSSTHIGETYW